MPVRPWAGIHPKESPRADRRWVPRRCPSLSAHRCSGAGMDSVRRGWPGGAGQTAGNRDLGDHTNLGDELPPLRNRHNGCITTGKVARTDPFPQIAAGAGQPRAPAGRSTEIRRPFHPFGAAITRCFHRHPSAAHTDPPPAGVVDHARWRGIRLGGQCRQRWAGERDKPWQGTVHRGRPSAARGWAPSRHRAAPHPCGHVAVLPVVVRGGDLRCSTSLG